MRDGEFYLLVFNKWEVLDEINLNQEIDLDNFSRPLDNFAYPMMTVCFIDHNQIFVVLYHTCT